LHFFFLHEETAMMDAAPSHFPWLVNQRYYTRARISRKYIISSAGNVQKIERQNANNQGDLRRKKKGETTDYSVEHETLIVSWCKLSFVLRLSDLMNSVLHVLWCILVSFVLDTSFGYSANSIRNLEA
jgi:hypothetical protein